MRSKRAVVVVTILLVTIAWFLHSALSQVASEPAPVKTFSVKREPKTPIATAPQAEPAMAFERKVPGASRGSGADPLPSLSEILRSDNVCALEKFISRKREDKKLRTYQAEAEDAYFSVSPFKARYNDYAIAVSGMPGATSKHGRFISALRMADWIEDGAKFEGLVDVARAVRDLKALALEDAGNAAPLAFAFALSKGADPELASLIRQADRFDSYQLDYLRALADFDDSSMVSFLMRVSHHATLAIPNWTKFRTEFALATDNDSDLRLHVTDLMMKNAKEAKNSSYELGYNVLETAFARAIAGGSRAYPKFTEIDSAFPLPNRASIDTWMTLMSELSSSNCDPAKVARLKAFVTEFRSKNPRSNLAF